MKKRRGIKKEHQEERGALTPTIVWGLGVLVFLVGVMFVAYQTKRSLRPLEYEGKIIDKWAGYSHSELGSFPYFRVLVETDGGQRMTVAIDRDNYERAKVGMRIKKTPKGLELARVKPIRGEGLSKTDSLSFETRGLHSQRWEVVIKRELGERLKSS